MKVLIFGGTTEGRKLSAALAGAGIDVTLSVAYELGRDMVDTEFSACGGSLSVLSGKLGEESMLALMERCMYDYVIDATHPYALLATENISLACIAAGVTYLRLKRPESERLPGAAYVSGVDAAVDMLKNTSEKVLLTIGSKELEPFTQIENFADRFFIRILPMEESLKKAVELGFRGSNIICMQGPFDVDMNAATIRMTGAKYLVTKDSGEIGGVEAKAKAALITDCTAIVISRPFEEEGYTFSELLDIFNIGSAREEKSVPTAFFPMFVDIKGKMALIIGGGGVAERRARILAHFGADITVVSPENTGFIKLAASQGTIRLIDRVYEKGDIAEIKPFLVIASTNDRQANHEAMEEAMSLSIPVSVADCREECSFYFPAIAEGESYIAGLVSKNGDHAGVSRTAEKIRRLLSI